MKEYPEPNYFLHVSLVGESIDPALLAVSPRTYRVGLNDIMAIIVAPWLLRAPWPPPFPPDFDSWADREEAARYLFATNAISIAPVDEQEASSQTVVFDENPESAHTVFWLPRAAFEALLLDVERVYNSDFLDLPNELRLGELQAGPLLRFIQEELPNAPLHAYARRILCLEPEPSRGE